jgi:hypothetical protein
MFFERLEQCRVLFFWLAVSFVYGTVQSTGTDILSDPWSFFLWLQSVKFDPIWVSAPPKVPTVPKGAVI